MTISKRHYMAYGQALPHGPHPPTITGPLILMGYLFRHHKQDMDVAYEGVLTVQLQAAIQDMPRPLD